jgi:hypothetical protein
LSQDFTMALVGPWQRVAVLLASIDRQLSEVGALRGSAVSREDLDGETEPEQEIALHGRPVLEILDNLISWDAASMEFRVASLTIEVLVGERRNRFSNCFLRTDLRSFTRLFQQNQKSAHYKAVLSVAEAMAAAGGYGGVELDLDPLAPAQLIGCILGDAAKSIPAGDLGLLSKKVEFSDRIEAKFAEAFQISDLGPYRLLENREFLELYPRLSV